MAGKKKQEGGSPVGSPNISESKEQDRFLPIANVSRIMKKSLPPNAKISKEAKETVQECVSEFISFITGEASDKCQREKRKTINGDDLLWAMTTLGFENYVGPLKVYLNNYRDTEEGDKDNSIATQEDHHHDDHDHDHDRVSSPHPDHSEIIIIKNRTLGNGSLFSDHQMELQAGFYSLGSVKTYGDGNRSRAMAAHQAW
ncbi:Nuclear transcription factor Y subunit B [Euphorbia peplus]|nr:Nuclear transcription factor Y subunit B [Euphorbia peplus]